MDIPHDAPTSDINAPPGSRYNAVYIYEKRIFRMSGEYGLTASHCCNCGEAGRINTLRPSLVWPAEMVCRRCWDVELFKLKEEDPSEVPAIPWPTDSTFAWNVINEAYPLSEYAPNNRMLHSIAKDISKSNINFDRNFDDIAAFRTLFDPKLKRFTATLESDADSDNESDPLEEANVQAAFSDWVDGVFVPDGKSVSVPIERTPSPLIGPPFQPSISVQLDDVTMADIINSTPPRIDPEPPLPPPLQLDGETKSEAESPLTPKNTYKPRLNPPPAPKKKKTKTKTQASSKKKKPPKSITDGFSFRPDYKTSMPASKKRKKPEPDTDPDDDGLSTRPKNSRQATKRHDNCDCCSYKEGGGTTVS
jgi:hypothetical protein